MFERRARSIRAAYSGSPWRIHEPAGLIANMLAAPSVGLGSRQETVDLLRFTEARRRSSAPNELDPRRPAAHVLIVRGRVPADERHVRDVYANEMEAPGFRVPTEFALHDLRVNVLHFEVLFGDSLPPDLVLAG